MLVLVVGPSGAGKDTLLGAVKADLEADPRFRFVRRVVTRPTDGRAADEEFLEEAEFRARRDARAYALWWQAHGLFYGVPADIAHDLGAGRVVVASVSRAILAEAAARFPVRVVEITAPHDILARRLAARGREDAASVAERLARAVPLPPALAVTVIVNDGTIEQGTRALRICLHAIAEEARLAP
jgi:ribose 1,5-bisphosphokinase